MPGIVERAVSQAADDLNPQSFRLHVLKETRRAFAAVLSPLSTPPAAAAAAAVAVVAYAAAVAAALPLPPLPPRS